MTSKLTREQLHERARENVKALKMASRQTAFESAREEILADLQLAELALAAMDSESGCLPLDYLQGHKDGLEWAAQLAEANHPETGDWLYDDPIELAKAIRKGPDMPPAQPAADSEPVAIVEPSDYVTAAQLVGEGPVRKAVHELYEGALRIGDKLYRHAQQPVVPDKMNYQDGVLFVLNNDMSSIERGTVAMRAWNACRAAMLAAAPHDTPTLNSLQSVDSVAGKWIPVSERMPDDSSDVLCTAEFDGPGDWRRKVGYWHEGKWVVYGASWTPTHWMPLPAAPQEVK